MYEFFHILVFCDKFSRAKNLNRSHRKKIYRCEFSFQFQYIAVPNSFEFKAAPQIPPVRPEPKIRPDGVVGSFVIGVAPPTE